LRACRYRQENCKIADGQQFPFTTFRLSNDVKVTMKNHKKFVQYSRLKQASATGRMSLLFLSLLMKPNNQHRKA